MTYICPICGHVIAENPVPNYCPICHCPSDDFIEDVS